MVVTSWLGREVYFPPETQKLIPLAPSTLSPHPSFRQLHQISSHSSPPLWTPPCPLDVSPHPSKRPTSPHYWRNPLWTPPLFRTTVQYHSSHFFLKPLNVLPLTNSLLSFLRITCWTPTSPASDLATQQRLHSSLSKNPCRLLRQPPSPLSWFSSISRQPSTLSTTPSFCPPWQLQESAARP